MTLDASPYLSTLIDRFGAPEENTAPTAIESLDWAAPTDLPRLKAQFNLGWAHLALQPDKDFASLGQLQSRFADNAIHCALAAAWRERNLPGDPKGLFILGLGKLGGHDLNFSSDIDLIAYFDPDVFPVPKARGQAHVAGQIMKALTQTLQPRGAPDFVYRVDWRLRPEASVSGLAMSTERAEQFYFQRALPWHRLALLKARVVAGDRLCGSSFLDGLTPFLWRQNLDFRTIDQLADLKHRINLEHPRLRLERAQRDAIGAEPLGFNVKLGTGGIREIEFIANALQMIWGGKDYSLRTTNTLQALAALSEASLLEDGPRLANIYRHHRRLENALQMLRNGQEHVLPETPQAWEPIAKLLGKPLNPSFIQVTDHRHHVHAAFTAMFEATEADPSSRHNTVGLPALKAPAQAVLSDWDNGFRRYGLQTEKAARLKPLAARLQSRLASVPDPDEAIQRVDSYLGTLSRSGQYLALLSANPSLLDALIGPLLYSPHMSVLLEQSPHIIDTFLSPSPPDPAFVLAEEDYETRLERLRRFVNEGLFQAYHAFLGTGDAPRLSTALTTLAETAVATAVTIMRDDLGAADLPISVLGLGKLGEARMAPQSDLDLVFLFTDNVDRDLAARAVRRLSTILTTPLREGIAYELDMRLRPSGRSGPPAVTLTAFRRHHAERARTWEHIALIPARAIAGDETLGADVRSELNAILRRPRDLDQLYADAHHMWNKLKDERIQSVSTDHWGTKLREGGLMMADFWGAVDRLAGGGGATDLQTAWTELLYWERLLGLTGQDLGAAPAFYTDHIPNKIAARQETLERQTKHLMRQFPRPNTVEPMQPVRWRD